MTCLRRVWNLLFLFCFFAGHATLTEATSKSSYIISVVPQRPPITMSETWSPFMERLKTETGHDFKLKVYETMDAFEKDYIMGIPDFIFVNPSQAVIAYKSQGYDPLVRSNNTIAGILFVKKNSPISSMKDLKGKEVAFVGARNV